MSLTKFLLTLILLIHVGPITSLASNPHVIKFRSPNLYPEGITWDPSAQHFIVGSLHHRTIHSVSDAGVTETLISDPTLPPNSTIPGLAIDPIHKRLLAVVHSASPLPPFNALAAYDLRDRSRIFLSLLTDGDGVSTRPVANDVAVDFRGNAYVTNSAGNFIWRVNADGESSVFSRSPLFTSYPVDEAKTAPFSECGLNGIAYVSKGYLLVVQSNTGKMFKVDAEDGWGREVLLTEELTWADGVAIRGDGVVLVVSPRKLWFLKSRDSWGEGVVYDKIDLDVERFPTSVGVGGEDRVYVLYGHVLEGIKGNVEAREWFDIEEVRSVKESKEENVWIFVFIGLGLAYFLFWRFQMKQLVKNMDKKIN
ncbi:SGL domain-containing protein [Cephalotus follicularis]|uniref:SGL domain-containing protein n=1 Tax=Cephalotus follicularis TaxID=3775 RepID=A0A1Q3DD71_CEPFO|nr:SGL domain-containing protein [Cephalotus follicularis]